MTSYRVTDKHDRVIEPGDTVTDFRGDTAKFVGVTRGPEYNGTAMVSVEESGSNREYYARVFDLTVTPIA